MDEQVAGIIASSSPASIVTGELIVLKNVIKRHAARGESARLVRLVNAELGALCGTANTGNLEKMRAFFARMVELVKRGELATLEYEVKNVRIIGFV